MEWCPTAAAAAALCCLLHLRIAAGEGTVSGTDGGNAPFPSNSNGTITISGIGASGLGTSGSGPPIAPGVGGGLQSVQISNGHINISELDVNEPMLSMHLRGLDISFDSLVVQFASGDNSPTPVPTDSVVAISFSELSSSINASLDPCDNFYQYVSSGWLQANPVPDDQTAVDQLSAANTVIRTTMEYILAYHGDLQFNGTLPPFDAMLLALYSSCNDTAGRLTAGSKTVLAMIKGAKGAPTLTEWLQRVWPVGLFHSVGVDFDPRNSSRYILTISPSELFLGDASSYLDPGVAPAHLSALSTYFTALAELLYQDDLNHTVFTGADYAREVVRRSTAFVDVETAMAKIVNGSAPGENAYADDQYVTVQQLHDQIAGTVNWTAYLQQILPTDVLASAFPGGIGSAQVRVSNTQIVKQFDALTRSLGAQQLSDYMDWKVVTFLLPYLDERFQNTTFKDYDSRLRGVVARTSKQTECTGVVRTFFPEIMDRVYMNTQYFDLNATQSTVVDMVSNLAAAFYDMLAADQWMDNATRAEAYAKLQTMQVLVASMDTMNDDADAALRSQYKEFNISAGQPYLEAVFSAFRTLHRIWYRQLTQPTAVKFFFTNPKDSVFYQPYANAIVLTGAALQQNEFNADWPAPLNYGSAGFLAAQLLTHGFDYSVGRLHDESGNLRTWWDNATTEAYLALAQCMADQYSAAQVAPGQNISGTRTLSENVADNGALRAAYSALKTALLNNSTRDLTPVSGLEQFTPEQLFFANYAFSMCKNERPQEAQSVLLSSAYSPAEYRVNVALGNMVEFAEQFSCALGTGMNPVDVCKVW